MWRLRHIEPANWNLSRDRIRRVPREPDMEMTVAGSNNQDATDPTRFPFGRNWASFLGVLTEARIQEAERSLKEMLGAEKEREKRNIIILSVSLTALIMAVFAIFLYKLQDVYRL